MDPVSVGDCSTTYSLSAEEQSVLRKAILRAQKINISGLKEGDEELFTELVTILSPGVPLTNPMKRALFERSDKQVTWSAENIPGDEVGRLSLEPFGPDREFFDASDINLFYVRLNVSTNLGLGTIVANLKLPSDRRTLRVVDDVAQRIGEQYAGWKNVVHRVGENDGESPWGQGLYCPHVHRFADVIEIYKVAGEFLDRKLSGLETRELDVLRRDALGHENVFVREGSAQRYRGALTDMLNDASKLSEQSRGLLDRVYQEKLRR